PARQARARDDAVLLALPARHRAARREPRARVRDVRARERQASAPLPARRAQDRHSAARPHRMGERCARTEPLTPTTTGVNDMTPTRTEPLRRERRERALRADLAHRLELTEREASSMTLDTMRAMWKTATRPTWCANCGREVATDVHGTCRRCG